MMATHILREDLGSDRRKAQIVHFILNLLCVDASPGELHHFSCEHISVENCHILQHNSYNSR